MGILRFSSVVNDFLWIVPHTLNVMVTRGLTFRLVVLSVCRRGLYLLGFSLVAALGYMLWHSVVVIGGVGIMGSWLYVGSPRIHKIVK